MWATGVCRAFFRDAHRQYAEGSLMRVAVINWTNRRIGGTGTYLSAVMPYLQRAGHEVGLWHEVTTPADYDVIPVPPDAPTWSVTDLGLEPALAALAEWRPH